MCIFTPWGILPRTHHRRKSNTTPTPTTSTSSPSYAPRLVHIQPPKHNHSLTYPVPKSKPPSANNHRRHLSSETRPLLSRSPPLRTRTSPPSTYPSHQLRIRHLTAQLLQRQTLETRRDVLASLEDRYHDVPQQSSPSSSKRRTRRATISPPLSSSNSSESESSYSGWSSDPGAFDGRARGRGRGGEVNTPATSVSVSLGGGVGAPGGNVGNANGGAEYGYGYTLPFVQAPQLPLFGAGSSSSVVSGSAEGSEASTVSEYWGQGRGVGGGGGGGVGGGWRYWNDSAPVGSRLAGGGVVNSWGEGRRRTNWDRGAGVGYATMGGLREARERTERGLGRLEGEIGRARAGVGGGGYRLWTWE